MTLRQHNRIARAYCFRPGKCSHCGYIYNAYSNHDCPRCLGLGVDLLRRVRDLQLCNLSFKEAVAQAKVEARRA